VIRGQSVMGGQTVIGGQPVRTPPSIAGTVLGLLLLLLRRREENVVQNQTVPGRVLVEFQFGRRIADPVLIVLRVMAAQEREGALPVVAMQVSHLLPSLDLAQEDGRLLDQHLVEGGGLTHEPPE